MEKRIKVELRGPLIRYGPAGSILLSLEGNTTVANVLDLLRIPEDSTSMLVVNGKKVNPLAILEDRDHLVLYPPIAGG